MPLPEDYKINDGCWDCSHLFSVHFYDEPSEYYCWQDKSNRPLCDSLLMKESFTEDMRFRGIDLENISAEDWVIEHDKLMDIWDKWAKEHKINLAGTCSKWEKLVK